MLPGLNFVKNKLQFPLFPVGIYIFHPIVDDHVMLKLPQGRLWKDVYMYG